MALNRTVLPTHRGTMNGLVAVGSSVAKALGPTFAGALVTASLSSCSFLPHAGSVLLWLVIGGLGATVTILFHVLIPSDDEDLSKDELTV